MKSLVARRNRCISASTFRGSWSRSCQRVFLLQKFEFVDLEDAKYMYETLMGSSRRLRYGRRRVLQVAYQLFCGTSYSRFGRVILEKRETQTNLRIAVTKSARVVQTASAREIANTAKSKHKPEAGKRPHDGSLFGQDIAIENSQNCTPARSTYIPIAGRLCSFVDYAGGEQRWMWKNKNNTSIQSFILLPWRCT